MQHPQEPRRMAPIAIHRASDPIALAAIEFHRSLR
jgi:hypothetical protein